MGAGFTALVADKPDGQYTVTVRDLTEADLMPGDVTVAVAHSTVNYKDGLAITGKAPVVRKFPLILGIDFAGTVTASDTPDLAPGDKVILNGWGAGETHHGGYAQVARVPAGFLVKQPDGITSAEAMAIGTAGYTAMLCVMRLEQAGITPAHGDILVTGAAGGVGSVAISLLASLGYRVIASTGRPQEETYLKSLGAAEVIDRAEFNAPAKPLARERFAGAVDSVGSLTLANVLSQIRYGGAVAACGLAQGMDLPSSVAPFILRGVSLLGVDSVMAPKPVREAAWARLARDLDRAKLSALSFTLPFDSLIEAAPRILAGEIRGRAIVTLPN